jgi:ATP-dependent exoDNAse (exonuclease V) beta subunit
MHEVKTLPRELILASAGSGKTFRLSSRIIGLLARGEEPEAVLASTFTRKAAGEILARVLVRLAEAALDPAKATELSAHASLEPDSPPLDCARCLEILARLARAMHRLNVGTLDSLFVRAAQTFTHDLGLPPGWGIADEPTSRRIRAEALQEVLRQADPGTVVELVRLANKGEASRSVAEGLLRRIDELYEIHHQVAPGAAEAWTLYPGLEAGGGGEPDAAEREALAAAIEAIDVPRTSKGAPNATWAKAIAAMAEAVRRGDWEAFVGQTLTQKVLNGEEAYSRVPIGGDVVEAVEGVLEVACRVIGRRLSAQVGAMGRLVAHFDEAYAALLRREGAYRFDDVTRLLGGPGAPGARPDLGYRLDARLRHLLLDEFQDTSVPQWSALEPLVDAIVRGEPGAAVVVADPKQSIYGWRGARPELVRAVGERYVLDHEVLATSWRSSQVVLDAVNAVFGDIAGNDALDDAGREVAEAWARDFAPHVAAKALPGHVRLVVGPDDGGRAIHRPKLLAHAAALVRELHEEAPGFGIGVLTRENKAVARVIHELRKLGIEASEEGGNPLTDSPAVASVLALLHLADHPDDRIARYHVAKTPVGEAVGYRDPEDGAAARRLAHRFRERLLRDGYGATLDALARALRPSCGERDARRLAQLVELALRYDARATLRPTDFVRLVEAERVEDPTAAPVRVMTIHQSKGLEFDVVVLPELDVPVFKGGNAPAALPFRETPTGPIVRVFPYVDEKLRPLFPEIEEAYRQHRAAGLRDALSTLYVAMTRARYALHMVVKPDGASGMSTSLSPAMIVRHALAGGVEAREGDLLYESGDALWHRAVPHPEVRHLATTSAPVAVSLRESPPRRVRMLPRRKPSGPETGEAVDLRERLRLGGDAAREHGTLVHAWCEEIVWLEDGLPDDERLLRIARRLAPALAGPDVLELAARFRGWVAQPAIAAALRRAAYPAGARVERESRFVHRAGDAIVEGIIDRLVLWGENGRVEGAEVLDYKTDAVHPDDAEAIAGRTALYRPQLSAYRDAVAALYGLDPDRIRAKLLFLRAGVVVEPLAGVPAG